MITSFHAATARRDTVDADMIHRWIEQPVEKISRVVSQLPGGRPLIPKADRLADHLTDVIYGQAITLSWVHGDFVPGNILVSPKTFQVTGIVDWELSHPNELPQMDIYQWILASRREVQKTEFGHLVRGLIDQKTFTADECRLIDLNRAHLPGGTLDFHSMLLLFWLEHIHANLTKSTRYDRHWVWIYRNIVPVLDQYRS
jgi:Ser/Thr protein kinase RdoA (MazF antagonist)